MSERYEPIGAYKILKSTQLSIWNFFDFVFHYQWTTKTLTVFTGWGGSWNPLVKLVVWAIYMFLAWVPLCLGFKFLTFYGASIFRLITNVGGKKGFATSLAYVAGYTALIPLVYIPYILPEYWNITGESLLEWLKII